MRALRHVLALGSLLALIACAPAAYGEIALDAALEAGPSWECPVWSPCPLPGLAFEGLSTGGAHPLMPMAAGGSEGVRVLDVTTNGAFVGDRGTTRAFDAIVRGDAVHLDGVMPPDIALSGAHAGTSHLDVVMPGTTTLIDTIELHVEDVVETRLVTFAATVATDVTTVSEIAPGGTPDFTVQLVGTSGALLWDDSLSMRAPTTAPASGAIGVVVHRDAGDVTFVMPVARAVTSIAVGVAGWDALFGLPDALVARPDETDTIHVDLAESGFDFLCAVPMDGRLAIGGSEATLEVDQTLVATSGGGNGCLQLVYLTAPGRQTVDVTLSALGATRALHLDITTPSDPAAALVARASGPRVPATLGSLSVARPRPR